MADHARRSLISRLRGRSPEAELRDSLENPSMSIYAALVGMTDGTLDSATGASVTPQRAVKVVAFLACLKLLAETIAALPVDLFTRDDKGNRVPVTGDSRLELLQDEPNEAMTAFDFWCYVVVSMIIWGNAYVWIERDSEGEAVALWPIVPTKVRAWRSPSGIVLDVELPDGTKAGMLPGEYMHFRGISLDTATGLSTVKEGRNAIGIAMAAEDYAGRMFVNDGTPGAVYSSAKPMNDEQFAQFSARIKAGHEGLRNAHKWSLLPPGMTYQAAGFDPTNLQMVEARKFQVREIARMLRIPPHMIGDLDGSATFASVEQMSIDFLLYTLRPWLVNIQQVVKRTLLGSARDKASGMFMDHDTEVLLRADSVSRSKIDSVYRLAGIKTANEVRESLGLPPVEGGDVLWQPVNVQVIGPDGEVAMPAAQPPTTATGTPPAEAEPGTPEADPTEPAAEGEAES